MSLLHELLHFSLHWNAWTSSYWRNLRQCRVLGRWHVSARNHRRLYKIKSWGMCRTCCSCDLHYRALHDCHIASECLINVHLDLFVVCHFPFVLRHNTEIGAIRKNCLGAENLFEQILFLRNGVSLSFISEPIARIPRTWMAVINSVSRWAIGPLCFNRIKEHFKSQKFFSRDSVPEKNRSTLIVVGDHLEPTVWSFPIGVMKGNDVRGIII